MHLKKIALRNFRRLRHVVIDLEKDISIFVGPNNSGKTSVGHALHLFTAERPKFTIYDFSADQWKLIDDFGDEKADTLPSIELDLWFSVTNDDLHRVVDILPNLAWNDSLVGMRVAFVAKDPAETRARYTAAHAAARQEHSNDSAVSVILSPRSLREYLQEHLLDEYELRYFVLDPVRFDHQMQAREGYTPSQVIGDNSNGRAILDRLLRVDILHAQRNLADTTNTARTDQLSHALHRYYQRHLKQRPTDLEAIRALSLSEHALNKHLDIVFRPTLERIAKVGYPGFNNPRLVIRSALDTASITQDRTRVHYEIDPAHTNSDASEVATLPDTYNGLGFKNLIFMVIELLDIHEKWLSDESPAPVHLIFIEEPEAHLHPQPQQAFIRQAVELIGKHDSNYTSQIVVTTHSTHILYERGFRPIRYFRRDEDKATSQVLNLSGFYCGSSDESQRTFLERYLKLTHCDLFFADAAVLVEGNVERLLLPEMIAKVARRLQSAYLTILEINGAFAHRFKDLLEFLGLTVLIITDLDSVAGTKNAACMAGEPGARTSNQTLQKWLPRCDTVADLWNAGPNKTTQARDAGSRSLVRVVYQRPTDVTWNGAQKNLAGRTFEEAFALENLAWCQHEDRKDLGLFVQDAADMTLEALAKVLYERVRSSNFNKTSFALALLSHESAEWSVPSYVADGLTWLEAEVVPENSPARDDSIDHTMVAE